MLRKRLHAFAVLLLLSASLLHAQSHPGLAAHIRGEMSFLASDALRGRGSATPDEFVAATYVVSQFQSFGLEDAKLQTVPLPSNNTTYNAVALLRGSDPELSQQTILLSSHLDHLGTRHTPVTLSSTVPMTMPAAPPQSSNSPAPWPRFRNVPGAPSSSSVSVVRRPEARAISTFLSIHPFHFLPSSPTSSSR